MELKAIRGPPTDTRICAPLLPTDRMPIAHRLHQARKLAAGVTPPYVVGACRTRCTLDRWIIMSCPRPWTLLQSAGVARRSTVPPLIIWASLGRSVGCPHSLRADAARHALQPHARRSTGFQNATRAAALAIRRRQAVCARRQPVAAGTAGRRRVRFDGRRRAGGARARYARCGGRRLPLVRGRGTPLAGSPVHPGAGWQTLVQSVFGLPPTQIWCRDRGRPPLRSQSVERPRCPA